MRILQIASGVPPHSGDPCTIAMHGVSSAFVQLGHSVHAFYDSEYHGQHRLKTPYTTERLPSPFRSHVLPNSWLAAGLRQAVFGASVAARLLTYGAGHWDLICFYATTPALVPTKIARRLGIPTVYRHANPLLTQAECGESGHLDYSALGLPNIAGLLSQLFESSVAADATAIVVLSRFAEEQLARCFGLPPEKIAVVPNGVDTDGFKPAPRSSSLMARYGIRSTTKVVLCVARIAPYKNQLTLVKAIPEILNAVSDTVFLFVGPTDDSTYLEEIEHWLTTHKLEERVVFAGRMEPWFLPDYYSLADVFVLPSLAEGFPLVLLEAMSCGKAIVASSLPQHVEVAEQDDAMLLADPRSARAIGRAIVDILQDDSLRLRLQEKARRLAVLAYDWKVVAGAMLKACTEAVGHNVRPRD